MRCNAETAVEGCAGDFLERCGTSHCMWVLVLIPLDLLLAQKLTSEVLCL
jgi:hypothetical protein